MKKLNYIIIIICIVAVGSGCKKFLDLSPQSEVAQNKFYKTLYDVNAAVAGMYSGFQQQMIGEAQYKERALFWGDYRSDNFDRFLSYTTITTTEVTMNALTTDNEFSDWSGLYTVIGRANANIKYIPGAAATDSRVTQAVIDKALAESYAMRAISYFYIVRVWGDAPIWTTPMESLSDSLEKPRVAASKVIDEQIIPDLTNAYSLVTKNQTASVWTLGEGAICAILADVYMWKHDYANAIVWIKNLFKAKGPTGALYAGVNGTNLQPQASWKNLFTVPNTSIESIWSIHWDFLKNDCACMTTSWTANNKPIAMDIDLYNNWVMPQTVAAPAPVDIRPKQTIDPYSASNDPTRSNRDRFIKWYASPANPTKASTATELATYYFKEAPVYFPMYRLADMYLLYAEALNATGDPSNALKYLNFVRVRAGLPAYVEGSAPVADQTGLADAILKERQLELVGEGKRWFDLVRTGNLVKIMDPILRRRQIAAGTPAGEAIGFSDPRRILWPVNRSVLNANKKLVQNPGYGG
ncbi:RagB/SusD family nutrient uptake outer membrane protein [Niabella pedocola]|uniref:RagB/SusD family nutrient uptake outer membrane protein n=1 Tax=Niabella pedocola TaxID=1752077 RepID=A0ABS8PYA1_9BACT|nr:RagB/SusD family nutrient uptake outer membrane protein [Niabella pedocola]MCD2425779.1 RagB/SusD family nutrient uptake outer membrane protein [Niabella pedocola]